MKNEESLKKISEIMQQWTDDLENYKRIGEIREALMNATTTAEVNRIAEANIKFIDRIGMWKTVNKAKKRILAIRRMAFEQFKNRLN